MRIFKAYRSNLLFTREAQEVRKETVDQKKKRNKKNEKQKNKNHAFTVENNHFENWISNFELNDFDEKKLAVLSKKMISDISKNK